MKKTRPYEIIENVIKIVRFEGAIALIEKRKRDGFVSCDIYETTGSASFFMTKGDPLKACGARAAEYRKQRRNHRGLKRLLKEIADEL